MKKIMLYVILLAVSATSFSQSVGQLQQFDSEDWQVKSKSQQTVAWILLGTGAAIAATGGIIQLIHENKRSGGFDFDFTGARIAIIGGAICLASVPFFIIASSNNKKGMSLSLNSEKTLQIQKRSFAYSPVPSLTLKISL